MKGKLPKKISVTFALLLLPSWSRGGEVLHVRGSSTFFPLAKKVKKLFEVSFPEVQVKLERGGSEFGINHALSGQGIGLVSRALKADELYENDRGMRVPRLVLHTIARDGIVVIVSKSNQIKNIEKASLRRILNGKIKNWSKLGGQDAAVQVYGPNSDHGTHIEFLKGLGVTSSLESIQFRGFLSHRKVISKVESDPFSIGWVPLVYFQKLKKSKSPPSVKMLNVEGVVPSAKTIRDNSYVLQRVLGIVTKPKVSESQKNFIEFFNRPEVQRLIEKMGHTPSK